MSYNDATVEGAPAPSFIVGAAMEAERVRGLLTDVERLSERVLQAERLASTRATSLSDFQEYVAKVTANFERGCRAGKREFLEELGLEMPPRRFDVTAHVAFTVELDEDEVYEHTFRELIEDAWHGNTDISVDSIEFEEDNDA
jgi:hypothetical protein